MSTSLIAFSETELKQSQSELLKWIEVKISNTNQHLEELCENLEVATRHGWRTKPLRNAVNLTNLTVQYYMKIKQAISEGYLLMPDFPINAFAIRVKRKVPKFRDASWDGFRETPQLLPEGEGRNVSPVPEVGRENIEHADSNGKKYFKTRYFPTDFKEVEFPVVAVKPIIIEKTIEAVKKNIFDEVGLVGERPKRDPVVVGRILDPRDKNRQVGVNFFIAWWIDFDAL